MLVCDLSHPLGGLSGVRWTEEPTESLGNLPGILSNVSIGSRGGAACLGSGF